MSKLTRIVLATYAFSGALNDLAHPERAWFLPEVIASAIGLCGVVYVICAGYELLKDTGSTA